MKRILLFTFPVLVVMLMVGMLFAKRNVILGLFGLIGLWGLPLEGVVFLAWKRIWLILVTLLVSAGLLLGAVALQENGLGFGLLGFLGLAITVVLSIVWLIRKFSK